MTEIVRDGLTLRWVGGGLYLEAGGYGLLLDVPPTALSHLGDRMGALQSVSTSGGRLLSVGGLVPLLCALEPHRGRGVPLTLRFPLGEERGPMLAETWVRGWPERYPVSIDAELPGAETDAGPFLVETVRLPRGEPRWYPSPLVEPAIGLGFRVTVGGTVVAFAPGAPPVNATRRLCAGADVVVVEAGVVPWPRDDARWRMSPAEAIACAGDAEIAWIVGDDGALVGAEA